jgi:hypothetical protein
MFIEFKPKPTEPDNRKPLDCLHGMSKLQWILHKTKQIEQANNWLFANLPTNLRAHCCCIAVHPQTLVISVNNAAWAHNLRMQTGTIICAIAKDLPNLAGLKSIKVKISGSALR